jgi:hypothetical protein
MTTIGRSLIDTDVGIERRKRFKKPKQEIEAEAEAEDMSMRGAAQIDHG